MDSQSSAPDPLKNPKKSGEEGRKEGGWIERLAQRSTGLQKEKPTSADSQEPSDIKDLSRAWQVAGLGFQFAATVLLFWFMGYEIDRHMDWNLVATLTCISIAVVGNTYLLIKEGIKANQDKK
jgi:hypothetical protein